MQFKPQSSPSTFLSLVKDPSAPKFQYFLDFAAVPAVLLAQTIVASSIKNFDDN